MIAYSIWQLLILLLTSSSPGLFRLAVAVIVVLLIDAFVLGSWPSLDGEMLPLPQSFRPPVTVPAGLGV